MPKEVHDVVVLLPGITGSVLAKRGEPVWGFAGKSLGTTLLTRGRWLRTQLELGADNTGSDSLPDGIEATGLIPDLHLIPGIWKIDGYSKVASTLRERFGLEPGKNFFEFPYDWRRDNRSAARRLALVAPDWLEQRRKSGHADAKLILIGHSMGGLVSRYFLEVLGGWTMTRALITFGTPYRGSLNALDSIANGVKKGPLGLLDLSALMRSFTSLYQLLPIYPAYHDRNERFVRVAEALDIPNLDVEKAKDALAFHTEIWDAVRVNRADPRWEERGYDLFPIVGIEQSTHQSARHAGDGVALFASYEGRDLSGDGTVPRVSAIPREFEAKQVDMYAATKHGSLQNADAVLSHVIARVEDLDLKLGQFKGFKRPPKEVQVSLETEDLVLSDEPVPIRARPSDPGVTLTASLVDEAGEIRRQIVLDAGDEGWQQGRFEPVAEGNYRVEITGEGVTSGPADSIAVADARATHANP